MANTTIIVTDVPAISTAQAAVNATKAPLDTTNTQTNLTFNGSTGTIFKATISGDAVITATNLTAGIVYKAFIENSSTTQKVACYVSPVGTNKFIGDRYTYIPKWNAIKVIKFYLVSSTIYWEMPNSDLNLDADLLMHFPLNAVLHGLTATNSVAEIVNGATAFTVNNLDAVTSPSGSNVYHTGRNGVDNRSLYFNNDFQVKIDYNAVLFAKWRDQLTVSLWCDNLNIDVDHPVIGNSDLGATAAKSWYMSIVNGFLEVKLSTNGTTWAKHYRSRDRLYVPPSHARGFYRPSFTYYVDGTGTDTGLLRLYMNGQELRVTKTVDLTCPSLALPTNPVRIGGVLTNGSYSDDAKGEAQDVKIWGKCLGAEKIRMDYIKELEQ